ncbi:MAG: radical SAM protein [Selenomonadaceae bacterium]|nr:radical SAM protein [Selenomonadaceae bacterium]
MFQVAIYSARQPGLLLKQLIEKAYNPIVTSQGGEGLQIAAFLGSTDAETSVIDDVPILDIYQVCALYKKKILQGFIIPRNSFRNHSTLINSLRLLGVDVRDIYITPSLQPQNHTYSEQEILSLVQPWLSAKYLSYMEYHIADHCNLNCKACEHYSGLVKTPRFPNFEKFSQDLRVLHKFIDDIGTIRILGGEPLLNPEINRYMVLTRKLYPSTQIFVVTNGILLPQMPEDFYKTMREQNIYLALSLYPPMSSKLPTIKKLLAEQGIPHYIGNLANTFTMKQTLRRAPTPDWFLHCFQAQCHNLYDGKLAVCFLPFTTKYFNEYFGKHLPEDGAIDLYDQGLTTEILKERLLTPIERCRYCQAPVEVAWEQMHRPSILSDWIADQ